MLTPKRAGYATITYSKGVKEFDTCTCCHCGRVWVTRSTEKGQGDPGGWCRLCMKPVCPTCAGKECKPFLRKLDEYEQRQKLFKDIGL